MRRLALALAAAAAFAAAGCDKDEPQAPPQPGRAQAEQPKEPADTDLVVRSPIPVPLEDKIAAAASPSGLGEVSAGRVLFDGDKPRSPLAGEGTGVWAGSAAPDARPKVAYTAPARPETLATKEPPSPVLGADSADLRDAPREPERTGTKKTAGKSAFIAKAAKAEARTSDTDRTAAAGGSCPDGMALIAGACMDRYEGALVEVGAQGEKPWPHNMVLAKDRSYKAVSAAGRKPQAYISADQAAAACAAAGKRLCSIKEWVQACQGPLHTQYPYGGTYQAGACNEHSRDPKHVSPMYRLFGANPAWDMAQMNDPRLDALPDTVAPSGSFAGCANAYGVYDMVGNVHEWVADRAGSRGVFKGGYFNEAEINGSGCRYATTAHGASYHDYSTGFRCCADAR